MRSIKDYLSLKKNDSFNKSTNAFLSMRINYEKTEEQCIIEQLTENLALKEIILNDKEFLMENLEKLREKVRKLKIFGAAVILRECIGDPEMPDISYTLTFDELTEIMRLITENNISRTPKP